MLINGGTIPFEMERKESSIYFGHITCEITDKCSSGPVKEVIVYPSPEHRRALSTTDANLEFISIWMIIFIGQDGMR
jgi:hypothetical protein